MLAIASLHVVSLDDWDMRSDRNHDDHLVETLCSLDDWDMRSDRNEFDLDALGSGSLDDWDMRSDRNIVLV